MMYSATFLASLLACAHGFAATPTGGSGPPELECSANEEKFFVYSIDPSLVYPFVASIEGGPDVTSDVTVTHGLVGNTWQGLQLSITQGDTTITQAGGKPLTVTSPNTLESGGFNVVSEDFCLGYGNWTVRMGAPTHPEMASYNASAGNLTMEERRAIGAPINAVPVTQAVGNWALKTINIDVNNFNGQVYTPFTIRWAIFPAEMRADAEAAAATGPEGMYFIEDNVSPAWAVYQVDYEEGKVVPGPVYQAPYTWHDAVPPPSADIPQPCYSALALDIDGTITTADAQVVYGLVQEARLAGSHVAINTARSQLHWKHAQTRRPGSGRAGRLLQPDAASRRVCMAALPGQSSDRLTLGASLLGGGSANHHCATAFEPPGTATSRSGA